MAIDLDKIKAKLNNLSQTNNRKNYQWKPQPGKQQVRIVPYKHQPDNPFIELYFHYGINNRTYLSPKSFGRPDPIVEFAEKLTRSGDKDDYRMGRSLMPKMRTFVPVIVRGEEAEGVRRQVQIQAGHHTLHLRVRRQPDPPGRRRSGPGPGAASGRGRHGLTGKGLRV